MLSSLTFSPYLMLLLFSALLVVAKLKMDCLKSVAIHCNNITKSYGASEAKIQALRGIDLDVYYGELLILAGPSGCGKTSLISICAGLLDADEGECLILGQNLKKMTKNEQAHFRGSSIGFVFQAFNLIPSLNILENVALPLLINGTARSEALDRALAMLETVEIKNRADAFPPQLSGGQQQRAAIARALIHEPKIIFCDEPTSNLDHQTGTHVMQYLQNAAQKPNRAIIVVTHDPRIFSFADRIAYMDDGKIVNITEREEGVQ